MTNQWRAEQISHEDGDLFVAIVTTLGGKQLIAQCTTIDFAKEIEDKHNRFDVEVGHLRFSLAGARDRAEAAEAERDEACRQLAEAQAENERLQDYINLIGEREGYLPEPETPLGQALDGQGDEVEP